MTSFTPVDEFDLRSPITIQEVGATPGISTNASDLIVQARAYNNTRDRSWVIDIPNENAVARDRALSLHNLTGYGALPLRWTPPGESEINVFINLPTGMTTERTTPNHHSLRVVLMGSR